MSDDEEVCEVLNENNVEKKEVTETVSDLTAGEHVPDIEELPVLSKGGEIGVAVVECSGVRLEADSDTRSGNLVASSCDILQLQLSSVGKLKHNDEEDYDKSKERENEVHNEEYED